MNDCWNTIGVRGDSSCAQLKQHAHCRNCPTYATAAMTLLDVSIPDGYLAECTNHVAKETVEVQRDTDSVVIFRIDSEWLALPSAVFKEIAASRLIHTMPHRRGGILGLVNVRGQLLVCVSLRAILGLGSQEGRSEVQRRLMVLERDQRRTVFPVDEVCGMERFHPRELTPVPVTIAKAAPAFTKAVLPWRDKSVGLLDEAALLDVVDRRLASATAI